MNNSSHNSGPNTGPNGGDDARRARDAHARPSALPWPPVLLVTVIAAAWLLGSWWPLPWPGHDDLAARAVGVTIGGLGVLLMGWAAWTMRAAKTTILPHKGAERLVTTGPFRRFRNPIYIADTMILLGLAELTKNIWFGGAAIGFVALVTWLAILPEERHLTARFGQAYLDYKARSRRWL